MNKILKFKIEDIETEFGIRIMRNALCIGLDTASKTGYCIITTNTKYMILDTGYFNIDVGKVKDKKTKRRLLAESIYQNLKRLFVGKIYDVVTIEDVFHGINAHTTILLSRIGGIAYGLAKEYNTKKILWFTACEARKALGLKGTAKKKEIGEAINDILGTKIKNDNVIDAIVLALNGLKE
jgi:Holliday junction resolvasome RuvABC endonuclease subunit